MSDGYAHLAPSQRDELAVAFHTFLWRACREGDLVVALDRGAAHRRHGRRRSRLTTNRQSLLTRPVLWAESRTPLEPLPAKLSAALEQEGHVVDLTAVIDLLTALVGRRDTRAA